MLELGLEGASELGERQAFMEEQGGGIGLCSSMRRWGRWGEMEGDDGIGREGPGLGLVAYWCSRLDDMRPFGLG